MTGVLRTGTILLHSVCPSLAPPLQKNGERAGRSDHVPRDVLSVILCVVLTIELLPVRSVVMSLRLQIGSERLFHYRRRFN